MININLNELAFDLAMLIFPFILAKIYTPVMGTSPLGIPAGQFLLLASIYFLPVLIGRMYNRDFYKSPAFIRKTAAVVLVMVTLFAYINLRAGRISTLKIYLYSLQVRYYS